MLAASWRSVATRRSDEAAARARRLTIHGGSYSPSPMWKRAARSSSGRPPASASLGQPRPASVSLGQPRPASASLGQSAAMLRLAGHIGLAFHRSLLPDAAGGAGGGDDAAPGSRMYLGRTRSSRSPSSYCRSKLPSGRSAVTSPANHRQPNDTPSFDAPVSKASGSGLDRLALRRLLSAPERASGCLDLRPA